ncbi:short-chain dehydrogenase [Niastella koreensis]|uniref:3-oxoacyl-(Acyl-carrier-protein) reductase n=2 Tax=Niastella koreensis TaxID=354356 RepID=G8TRH4_NIAKG|nr:SDR family oxidoreductase [Niastella koreensis]AEW01105.1 3-oxoacyl-(acyl-carrier-protein) reductase [Niastella koreensis GR20-10]OQP41823.1 short-chain dehydrogenase [Niastella koreensis]
MKKLENKVVVITGGNSGIGLSTAVLFAQQGAKVAITGRNQSSIDSAVKTIGHGAIGIVSDVSDLKNIDKAYKEIHSKLGKADVLIVNAGIFLAAPLVDFTEELFDQVSDVNFKGAFFSVQKALPYLNDGASVVLTSTALNEKGLGIAAAYSASKAAVRSLARSFSAELVGRNIRVNILSPGPIDTPIFARGGRSKEEVDGSKNYFASTNPTKRLGTSEEIAEGFLYLASDASKYVVGSELVIDGGVKAL